MSKRDVLEQTIAQMVVAKFQSHIKFERLGDFDEEDYDIGNISEFYIYALKQIVDIWPSAYGFISVSLYNGNQVNILKWEKI